MLSDTLKKYLFIFFIFVLYTPLVGMQKTEFDLPVAARRNQIPELLELLRRGEDVNQRTKDGYTALHRAASCGHKNIVHLLLAFQADVNVVTNEGEKPWQLAEENGHNLLSQMLKVLSLPENNTGDNNPSSLLQSAAMMMQQSFHLGTSEEGNSLSPCMSTEQVEALCEEIPGGEIEEVKNVALQVVDVSMKDKNGHTVLHKAAQSGNREEVELQLSSGADVNAADKQGLTPLYYAAKHGRSKIAELLLAKAASIDAICDGDFTPLHLAVHHVQRKIVSILLVKGANIRAVSRNGSTPLHLAAARGDCELVEFLLAKGADIEAVTEAGGTPLYEAINSRYSNVVRLLLASGAQVNAMDRVGMSPLFFAVTKGCIAVVKLLLDGGAAVDAAYNNITPLVFAIVREDKEAVKVLIAKGADTKKLRKDIHLFLAVYCDDKELVEILKRPEDRKGDAALNAIGSYHKTPLSTAGRREQKKK